MAEKKVRLVVQISGARDGEDWPKPGTVVSLPKDEAETLLRNGQAAEVNPPEENALADALGVEVATGNKSIRSQLNPPPHADEVQAYHVPPLPGEVPAAEEGQKAVDEVNADLIDVDAHKAQRASGPGSGLDELKDAANHPAAKSVRASAKKDGEK
jgi:hypothetical protein